MFNVRFCLRWEKTRILVRELSRRLKWGSKRAGPVTDGKLLAGAHAPGLPITIDFQFIV